MLDTKFFVLVWCRCIITAFLVIISNHGVGVDVDRKEESCGKYSHLKHAQPARHRHDCVQFANLRTHEPCKFTDLDICFCIAAKYLMINWPQNFLLVPKLHIVALYVPI